MSKRVKARPYTWNRGGPEELPGVMLHGGGYSVFIPGNRLRDIADSLHDAADQIENEQEQQ